jgi:hypothetical protein
MFQAIPNVVAQHERESSVTDHSQTTSDKKWHSRCGKNGDHCGPPGPKDDLGSAIADEPDMLYYYVN